MDGTHKSGTWHSKREFIQRDARVARLYGLKFIGFSRTKSFSSMTLQSEIIARLRAAGSGPAQ